MPVSRNLSLPASIENRPKKRPETLFRSNTEVLSSSNSTIQRSKPVNLSFLNVGRPNFLPTTTSNSNNNNDVSNDEDPAPTNESNELVADPSYPNKTVMGVDTTTTRGGTLSQPCLSVTSTIGATQIFPHLFLGSQKDVVDEKMMRSNGITYVLNVSKTCTKPEFIDDNHFHRISVHDSYQEKITPHMLEAIEFIEKVRKSNQRVIVHCLAGVSRSATVAVAYVLHYLRISFEEAYRFVKEKRPSISPNFNFLGQLMEFEKSLRQSGHLTCKRTGSLSEDGSDDEQAKSDFKPSISLSLFESPQSSNFSPMVMPATCSFKCSTQATAPHQSASGTTLRIPTPSSSFCRRRNGPTFREPFPTATNSNNNSSSRKTPFKNPGVVVDVKVEVPTSISNNSCNRKTPFENPGVVVDVKVKVPTAPRVSEFSRRLGSDGEKDEIMSCDNDSNSSDTFSPMRNQEVLPEKPEHSMDCNEYKDNLDDKFVKPNKATSPSVAIRMSGRSSTWQPGQLTPPKQVSRHRRCASGGGGISSDILQSPFSMKRRFEARTERSSSIGELIIGDEPMELASAACVKRGASFSGSYYDHSTMSSRSPHKFISVNSRSPKILRKSFQLNLRPVYSNNQTRVSVKSEYAAAPSSVLAMDAQVPVFDCSHSMSSNTEPLILNLPQGYSRGAMKEGTTPEAEADDTLMNRMTLSSPSVDKDGSPNFPSADSAMVKSPATCPVLTTQRTDSSFARIDSSPQFVCKGSFNYTSKAGQLTNAKTSQPFMLSANCDLKLKWRNNKDRRRQSADSGYLSSQASSQSSSSFTSPTSQQMVFGSGSSSQESFAEVASPDGARTSSPVNNTCHVEGAFVTPDDVTNSSSDPDSRKTNVRRRNAVEIMSCS